MPGYIAPRAVENRQRPRSFMIRLIVTDLDQVDSDTLANLDTIEACALLELALTQGLPSDYKRTIA